MSNYSYFDEAYFQTGADRGTAYNDFLTAAPNAAIFKEVANACLVLEPKRALEIGCATGVVVKHLNGLGVETHGIDVSQWAIDNRMHENAILAGAENLPYPDGYFDLVYSTHALEHIPNELAEAVFRELRRVTTPDAIQFHTLPIIGRGPYVGHVPDVIAALKNDPTHNILENQTWWLDSFTQVGFHDLGTAVDFYEETFPEHSASQLLLIGEAASQERKDRIRDNVRERNLTVLSALMVDRHLANAGIHTPSQSPQFKTLELEGVWADIYGETDFVLRDQRMVANIVLEAAEPTFLRFCFFGPNQTEATFMKVFQPGTTSVSFDTTDLYQPRDPVIGQTVRQYVFGGQGAASVKVSLDIIDAAGAVIHRL